MDTIQTYCVIIRYNKTKITFPFVVNKVKPTKTSKTMYIRDIEISPVIYISVVINITTAGVLAEWLIISLSTQGSWVRVLNMDTAMIPNMTSLLAGSRKQTRK